MIGGFELDLEEKDKIIVKLSDRLNKVNTNEQKVETDLLYIIKE